MEKEVGDFYQDGQRLLYDDDLLLGKRREMGTTIVLYRRQKLSPRHEQIKKDKR